MDRKKLRFFLATALFILSVGANAQSTDSTRTSQGRTPEDRAAALTEKMRTQLSLTDDQIPQVQVINLKYEVWDGDKEMVIIEPTADLVFRQELFSEDEIKSMQTVQAKLSSLKTSQLVNISHQEAAWKDNIEGKKLINYNYAFELMAV